MTVKLSLAIMTHPARAGLIPQLVKRLGPRTPRQIISDVTSQGVWRTARRAWEAAPRNATHHLVLQDDVIPCRKFYQAALDAIGAVPDRPISFYANRKIITAALEAGSSWAVIPDGAWGQAMCLPASMIPDWIAWCDRHVDKSFRHDDTRLTLWLLYVQRPVFCTVPSLVEHGLPAQSLAGNSNRNRVARCFIGADADGTAIDWTLGLSDPPAQTGPSFETFASKHSEYLKGLDL